MIEETQYDEKEYCQNLLRIKDLEGKSLKYRYLIFNEVFC